MSQSNTTKKAQASLESFFKPVVPASRSATLSSQPALRATSKAPPSHFPHPAFAGSRTNSNNATNHMIPKLSTASSQQSYTSSLSPPTTSPIEYGGREYEIPISPPKPLLSSSAPGRVVKSSDNEEEDSDSSLEDLTTILQTKRPINGSWSSATPSTPTSSRVIKPFLTSPMPVLSKHKFDLKSLASHAENDRKTEASSKRIKAMQEASQKKDYAPSQGEDAGTKLKHSELLQSVIADQEGGDIQKVARAVMRTEATLTEQRWYFFDTQANPAKLQRTPFPTKSVSEEWKDDLKDSQMRQQTFISGFAEDMVSIGKALPDEMFHWLLDEICVESSEPLRASYCNVLKASNEQVRRLMVPNIIQRMFEHVGANTTDTTITAKVKQVPALTDPYAKRDWGKLRSVIRLLGQIAKSLQARSYIISMLLRMSSDRLVLENVDIFDAVQASINQLCKYVPDETWETCCQQICSTLFQSVDQATLRLQMVQCTPSLTPRTHDLKRRLAMSFYFNNLSYSIHHSYYLLDLDAFIKRLDEKDFDTDSKTDYRELAALISLLDIAVDDGRNVNIDLSNSETEARHDKNVEEFGATIKEIMKSIGNPGAAYISRIEAKEVLDLVSQRILDTLRSKPKQRSTVFDKKKGESLVGEKRGMESFLGKGTNGVGGQASSYA